MADGNSRRLSASSRPSLERQQSVQSVRTARSERTDVFSDEFSFEPLAVADGFRPPSLPTANTTEQQQQQQQQAPPQTSATFQGQNGTGSDLPKKRVPSSQAGPLSRNSEMPQRNPSITSAASDTFYRPLSTLSNFSLPGPQSPYAGASTPSHPYGMYPQATALNRASSISTVRSPDRGYSGPSRPTHPYGMYPQATVDESAVNPLAASADIASVGFPGLAQEYTRRLGPDGEDADDIIGPDGHTEQLPPYTRYPNALPSKETQTPRAAVTATATTPLIPADSQAPSRPVDVPPEASNSAVQPATSPTDSLLSDEDRPRVGVAPATTPGESEENLTGEKYTERRRNRKLFGWLPRWALCLGVLFLVVTAAILGAVIGRMTRKGPAMTSSNPFPLAQNTSGSSPNPANTIYETLTTTLIDAAPTAIPSNLPALPTGQFGVPLGIANSVSGQCLVPAPSAAYNHEIAWQCTQMTYLGLNISQTQYDNTFSYDAVLSPQFSSHGDALRYGPQPPGMKGPAWVSLMIDINDPSMGPAYFFQQLYDKILVIPEYVLLNTTSSSHSKRSVGDGPEQSESETRDTFGPHYVLPDDHLWLCYWNSTILEGFIYVTHDADVPTNNVTNMVNSLASGGPYTATDGSAAASATRVPLPWPAAAPAVYPKVVKIEERRGANMPQPYCQKMQLAHDGRSFIPFLVNNQSVVMLLTETGPIIEHDAVYLKGGFKPVNGREVQRTRSRDDNSCHCAWIST